jgi:hypothetical protein
LQQQQQQRPPVELNAGLERVAALVTEIQTQTPLSSSSAPSSSSSSREARALRATVRLQALARGRAGRAAVSRALMAQRAQSSGVLVALPPTEQGRSGWYAAPGGAIAYFVRDGRVSLRLPSLLSLLLRRLTLYLVLFSSTQPTRRTTGFSLAAPFLPLTSTLSSPPRFRSPLPLPLPSDQRLGTTLPSPAVPLILRHTTPTCLPASRRGATLCLRSSTCRAALVAFLCA